MQARRALSVVGVLVAVLAVGVSPAQATIFERWNDVDVPYASGVPDFPDPTICGITVHIEGTFSSKGHLRTGKGRFDEAFFGYDNYSSTETWTANGRSVTVTANGSFREVKAVPLGGNLFEFISVEAGQPFRLFDADGNLVLRDRGAIRFDAVFDVLGDGVPSATLVEEFEPRVSGPHPGFDDETLCPVLVPLLTP